MRMFILSEDYGDSVLFTTDCNNKQIRKILEKEVELAEEGDGESLEEVCKELFPDRTINELGSTGSVDFESIVECRGKSIASCEYYSVYMVHSELS